MPIRLIILGIILLVIGFLLDVWSETAHLDISGNFLADVLLPRQFLASAPYSSVLDGL